MQSIFRYAWIYIRFVSNMLIFYSAIFFSSSHFFFLFQVLFVYVWIYIFFVYLFHFFLTLMGFVINLQSKGHKLKKLLCKINSKIHFHSFQSTLYRHLLHPRNTNNKNERKKQDFHFNKDPFWFVLCDMTHGIEWQWIWFYRAKKKCCRHLYDAGYFILAKKKISEYI